MDDKSIVDLYFDRSEQAIAETAAKYGRYCHTISYQILYNDEEAEECVNDTYLGAWNAMPPHRPSVLSAFLGKITRRLSLDRWRRAHAEKRGGGEVPLALDELADCLSGGEEVEEAVDKKQLSLLLASFVRRLPDVERRVFVCRYFHLESVEAVAARLGFSVSKVKSMLFRTRIKLRAVLDKEGYR